MTGNLVRFLVFKISLTSITERSIGIIKVNIYVLLKIHKVRNDFIEIKQLLHYKLLVLHITVLKIATP